MVVNINTVLIVGIIAVLLLVATGYISIPGFQFPTGSVNNYYGQYNPDMPSGDQFSGYTVMLDVDPKVICTGDPVRGSIDSNIPNGVCRIFVNPNNLGWQVFRDVRLDANGDYVTIETISTAGMATFRAVCADSQWNMKISNDVTLVVNVCGDDGDSGDESDDDWNPYDNFPCTGILHPPSQATCDQGYCASGTCTFYPATLVAPSYCACYTPPELPGGLPVGDNLFDNTWFPRV